MVELQHSIVVQQLSFNNCLFQAPTIEISNPKFFSNTAGALTSGSPLPEGPNAVIDSPP